MLPVQSTGFCGVLNNIKSVRNNIKDARVNGKWIYLGSAWSASLANTIRSMACVLRSAAAAAAAATAAKSRWHHAHQFRSLKATSPTLHSGPDRFPCQKVRSTNQRWATFTISWRSLFKRETRNLLLSLLLFLYGKRNEIKIGKEKHRLLSLFVGRTHLSWDHSNRRGKNGFVTATKLG